MRGRLNSPATAGVTCLVLLILIVVVALAMSNGSPTAFVQTLPRSSGLPCPTPTSASSCQTLTATTKSTVSQNQVNNFLRQLFHFNTNGQPPSVAPGVGLQRCSSDGTGPFTITCAFWSGTPVLDLDAVQTEFVASGLFATMQLHVPN
jgi:hypothetical protein